MNNVVEWGKKHWYIVAGALVGLWLLLKVVGKDTATSATQTGPMGTSITYGGTNASDAAVQVAQLQANSNVAAQSVAGALAVQQSQIALEATKDTNATNITLAGIQGANALAITNSNNAVAMRVSDNTTAAAVSKAQFDYLTAGVQYSAYRDVGVATAGATRDVGIAQANASRDVGVAQAGASRDVGIASANASRDAAISKALYDYYGLLSTNQTYRDVTTIQSNNTLAAVKDTNATQLAAYGIQAGVVNNQTAALRDIAITASNNDRMVQTSYIDTQGRIQAGQIANQSQLIDLTYQLERSGQFNKGGEGGVNQVAVWNALINPSSAASGNVAAAEAARVSSSQLANIIASIGNAVSTIASGGINKVIGALA